MTLDDLKQALAEVIDKENVDDWLGKPNDAFNGKTPEEAFLQDEFSLEQMIYYLESGNPN